jgi:hypothetical protein
MYNLLKGYKQLPLAVCENNSSATLLILRREFKVISESAVVSCSLIESFDLCTLPILRGEGGESAGYGVRVLDPYNIPQNPRGANNTMGKLTGEYAFASYASTDVL